MRVLLVDLAAVPRSAVERLLRQAEIEAVYVHGLRTAIERLREQSFDVVLCDLRRVTEPGLELLQWLGGHTPSTRVLIVAENVTEEFRRTYASDANVRIIDKVEPVQLVKTLQELGPRRGFHGNSIEIELFDYVQMIALTGRDKLIEVKTPRGEGSVWFEHGDIVHVEYQQLRGELAFYKLLSVGKGTFHELFMRPPPVRSVTRSSTHLLMEAARQADEGILGTLGPGSQIDELELDDESSFAELNEEVVEKRSPAMPPPPPPGALRGKTAKLRPMASDNEDEDFAALVEDSLVERIQQERGPSDAVPLIPMPVSPSAPIAVSESQAMNTVAGHTIFDDPDMRSVMLEQFWQFEGINGVAIISSTGKVLAEDMRNNSSLVTLAGFYMRGAARIARALGHNVFDGVVARSVNGQQMVMVSMGAASAVLSVAPGADPEGVRDAVMGVD